MVRSFCKVLTVEGSSIKSLVNRDNCYSAHAIPGCNEGMIQSSVKHYNNLKSGCQTPDWSFLNFSKRYAPLKEKNFELMCENRKVVVNSQLLRTTIFSHTLQCTQRLREERIQTLEKTQMTYELNLSETPPVAAPHIQSFLDNVTCLLHDLLPKCRSLCQDI